MDFQKLLIELISNGKIELNGAILTCKKELNFSIKPHKDGIKIEFLDTKPTVSIVRIIRISDTIDYIMLTNDGKMSVKTKNWFSEIPINLAEKS